MHLRNATVLIPVYNAEKTIYQALDSLVEQTYERFEIILIDDASTDATLDIVYKFKNKLPLNVIELPINKGAANAANKAINLITTPFIIRMDADDISLPNRIETQISFLESNPRIDVCGSSMEIFDNNQTMSTANLIKPFDDASIKTALIQYCSISQPAAAFRKKFFDTVGIYNTSLQVAEDYDLWCRGALLGQCYANIPTVLTRYRKHFSQLSHQKAQLMYEKDLEVKRMYISALLGGESSGFLAEFFSFMSQFANKEIALSILVQSTPLLFKLAKKIQDEKTYYDIITNSISRHLG